MSEVSVPRHLYEEVMKNPDRVTAERDAALAELSRANEKIDKAWNRTTAIDHKGFIPGALDAWKRPVPQHLPYDFSGSTSASTIQYCNGWNDSGSYWSAHAAELCRRVDALQQRLTAADERADVLEGLLLQTNELLYVIQGDPGAVPSSSIDAMRGEVFTALEPAEGGGDDKRKAELIRVNSAPHCPECGHPDCNGQCYGDDMMGD